MLINTTMDLNALAERMGADASRADAERMRDYLVEHGYAGLDTSAIAEPQWLAACEAAAQWAEDQCSSDCPMCGGNGNLLGTFGARLHWRCRDCGGQWSTRV